MKIFLSLAPFIVLLCESINSASQSSVHAKSISGPYSPQKLHAGISKPAFLHHQRFIKPGGGGKGGGGQSGGGGKAAEGGDGDSSSSGAEYEMREVEVRKNETKTEKEKSTGRKLTDAAKEQGHLLHRQMDHIKHEVEHRPKLSLLIFMLLIGAVAVIIKLGLMHYQFMLATKVYRDVDGAELTNRGWTFRSFVRYRFNYWFSWTEGSSMYVLLGGFIFFVLFFGIGYCITHPRTSALESAFKIFCWLVSPDGGVREVNAAGLFIGAFVSVGGLVFFALLLTAVQDAFNAYLAKLREGSSPVLESGHIVIIGFAAETIALAQELCKAYERRGGCVIAILCTQPKVEVEDEIRDSKISLLGSRLVVRTGILHDRNSLKSVAADACNKVIIMSNMSLERELRDAIVLQVLIQLRGAKWPIDGNVIASCSLIGNRDLFQKMGGGNTHVLMLDSMVAKLMVQCTRGFGLGMAVIDMLGFEGSEFYIKPVPDHLVGETLTTVACYYPSAIPAGVMLGDDVGGDASQPDIELCPWSDRRLQEGEELLLLSETDETALPCKHPYAILPRDLKLRSVQKLSDVDMASSTSAQGFRKLRLSRGLNKVSNRSFKEKVFIIGFNRNTVGMMLLEIDDIVLEGSTVTILTEVSKSECEEFVAITEHRNQKKLTNIKISYVQGAVASRHSLEMLDPPIETASRIFVLSDQIRGTSVAHADASVLSTVLHIRDVVRCRGQEPNFPIVPELVEARSTEICDQAGICDHVNAMMLHAKVVSSVVIDPRIDGLLDVLVSESDYVDMSMRSLSDYMQEIPAEVSFFDCMAAVREAHEVVVGWTVTQEDSFGARVELNPASKLVKRPWCDDTDKLMS
jgi:hypothetical protein